MTEPHPHLEIDDALIEALVAMSLEAGAVILEVRAKGATAEWKDDGSPVTEADARAEAIILRGLAAIAPSTPVIAEEAVAAGNVPNIDPSVTAEFFLVDPLDGTKEFLRTGDDNRGEFTVNIGLIRHGAPIAGVVFAPALNKIWCARPGSAWTADVEMSGDTGVVGERRPITVRPDPGAAVIAVASRSHRTPETDAYLKLYPVSDFRAAGSSLKFCLIAEGDADLYPRLGRTMEWDTAAGDAVLRAAGGQVVTMDGAPLTYGKRNQAGDTDFANPHFVALTKLEFQTAASLP